MDRARRARAEKLERDQAERARRSAFLRAFEPFGFRGAQQEAEAKARSREALFNTPFAGAEARLGVPAAFRSLQADGEVLSPWKQELRDLKSRLGQSRSCLRGVCAPSWHSFLFR